MKPLSIRERFWRFVTPGNADACWIWRGARHWNGYGQILVARPRRRKLRAHRVSWELHYGPVPSGMEVCHHCDNPPCVNPAHLFIGTRSDNARDASRKGRLHRTQGPMSPATVAEMLAMLRNGATQVAAARRFQVSETTVWRRVHEAAA